MKHRVFGILLIAVTLTACLFSFGMTALAADTEYGDFQVDTTVEDGCSYSGGVLTISKGGSYTVSMKEGVNETADAILIDAADVKLTLNDVEIASDTENRPALTLNYDASLEAQGTVSLTGHTEGKDITAGISGQGKTLTFLGGELKAQGGSGKGTGSYHDAEDGAKGIQANVVVKAGTLKATGGNGSELYANFSGHPGGTGIVGHVTVDGGTLIATGGNGGNSRSNGGDGGRGITGNVTVNGGTLIAKGGNGGTDEGGLAGHGGHGIGLTAYDFSMSYNVTVNGGAVSATGGNGGKGGNYSSDDQGRGEGGNGVSNCTVQINRGTLTSLAGDPGSGAERSSSQYYNRAFNNQSPTTATTDRDVKLWVGSSPADAEEADDYDSEKYAKYQVRMIYTLQFEGMADADYDVTPITSFIEGESAQIPNAEKANYHFLGWQINGLGDPIKNLTLEGDQYTETITLTAIWQEKETFPLTSQTQSCTYNGQPQSYTLDSTVTNVTVEYRVNGSFVEQAPVDAGSYDVKLTRPEDDAYKAFETTLVAGLMIHPADPVVTPPTAKTGLVYTGQAQTLVNPGSAQGGTVLYRVNDGAWSEEIPSATEVGTYQIAYQVEGDSNHNNIGDKALPAVEILEPITSCKKDHTCPIHPFGDADATAWYHDGVHYCIKEGLIKGYDTGLLGPNDVATRSQVVTLLWRAAGSPEPETGACPFQDAEEDSFYYEAMLWAVEKGITKGTSETTFAPNEICTRSQVVTLLWRAAGSPEPGTEACPFQDAEEDSFYYEAMLWAVEQGITTGTSDTTFEPAKACTRSEIATFLYRYIG